MIPLPTDAPAALMQWAMAVFTAVTEFRVATMADVPWLHQLAQQEQQTLTRRFGRVLLSDSSFSFRGSVLFYQNCLACTCSSYLADAEHENSEIDQCRIPSELHLFFIIISLMPAPRR